MSYNNTHAKQTGFVMSEQQFQVVVNGTLVEGHDADQVKQAIARLFKTTTDQVAPMFSGRALAVKKGLDRETAQKYRAAIIQAGLAATIVAMEASGAAAPAPGSDTGLAAPGSLMDETPPPAPPEIDTSALSMAEVGADVADPRQVAPAAIDTSQLSVAEPGADVTEHEEIPHAEIDTSGLSVAEVGADVTEHRPVPAAEIDTSDLSLDTPAKN